MLAQSLRSQRQSYTRSSWCLLWWLTHCVTLLDPVMRLCSKKPMLWHYGIRPPRNPLLPQLPSANDAADIVTQQYGSKRSFPLRNQLVNFSSTVQKDENVIEITMAASC